MVTDTQVRRLMKLIQSEKTLAIAAAKSGMDEKTARKYRNIGKLPSDLKKPRSWRTRPDPFADVWDETNSMLKLNPGLEAKTIFEYLQHKYPGQFADGQLRTFQRKVKIWRATEGPAKEVIFPQKHRAGHLCQSDFTHMNKLGITIAGEPFNHMLYHFVLTYSNWETGTVCFSESFESLSQGLQNALWQLGGVPHTHQTDCLTPAVQNTTSRRHFTKRYKELLEHYRLEGRKIQTGNPHENGDIEQRHYRFKKAMDQALMLRGSRDFPCRDDYEKFIKTLFAQLNSNRKKRFCEELKLLRRLPKQRLDACKRLRLKVGPSSTIRVNHNVYSVDSRLIGEHIEVRLYIDHLQIWYGQRCIEKLARIKGENKYRINYRHIIDCLLRKPAAFENYRYRDGLFPTSRFRIAYDLLRKKHAPNVASKEYLSILNIAAKQSETQVDHALRMIIDQDQPMSAKQVIQIVESKQKPPSVTDINITEIQLDAYDALLEQKEVA